MSIRGRLRSAVAWLVGSEARDGGERSTDGGRVPGAVVREKVHADREGSFVVFHIGMRINSFWKVHRWLPVAVAMPRMMRELEADPDSGLLGSRTTLGPGLRNVSLVQYWDSFESLREYARDGDRLHRPAWVDYYQRGTGDDGAAGIWHETYLVDAEEYETVYNNMPPSGLGAAQGSDLVPAAGEHETASRRLGRTEADDGPVVADGGDAGGGRAR